MRMKKLMSAVLAFSMTASAMLGSAAFTASAESTLTFDIRSGGENAVTISAEDIAAGDYTVPFDIYIPENPGINGVSLKLQVNDGEVAENGSFGNYGMYLTDAAFAKPYCFDSDAAGDPDAALSALFSEKNMNINWIYDADVTKLADAAEAEGTTAWDSTAEWAYTAAFAQANLVVPQGTPAGTYTLDIRTEEYLNALSADSAKPQYSKSMCTSDAGAVSFVSVPLTVTVEEAAVEEPWVKDYAMDTDAHYIIIADVTAKPGETVDVPVYVYNDVGTSGMQIFFGYNNKALTLNSMPSPQENYAYRLEPSVNPAQYPASLVFAQGMVETAPNGSILTYLNFTVPEDAADNTTYEITFEPEDQSGRKQKIVGKIYDVDLGVKMYGGSITVLSDDEPAPNYSTVNLANVGDTASLTLFNASGDVTWTSSDEAVATVDANGFVTATGVGTAKITVTNHGNEYTCTVNVGFLLGDVDMNGLVDVADSQLVLISYANWLVTAPPEHLFNETELAIANVNGDGVVDVVDSQLILNYYAQNVLAMPEIPVTWEELINQGKA